MPAGRACKLQVQVVRQWPALTSLAPLTCRGTVTGARLSCKGYLPSDALISFLPFWFRLAQQLHRIYVKPNVKDSLNAGRRQPWDCM